MLPKRLLTLIIPAFILILFEIFFSFPKIIAVIVVLIILAIFYAVWQFTKISLVDKEWWNFLILPASLSLGLLAFTTMLSSDFLKQILIILNSIIIYLYLRFTFYYLITPMAYKEASLENISAYGNYLTLFFIFSAVYGLQSFLSISIWILMLLVLLATGLAVYQTMWVNKIAVRTRLIYILISCLVMVELAWGISFLPLKFSIAGFILSICYYMLIGLVRCRLLNKLNGKIIKLYLGLGVASIGIVLLSARWL